MNTTTPLQPLTPAQRTAALAWIERGESTLRQVAAQLGLPADELLDTLTEPHVAAYIEAAENIIQIRENILARYDDIEARQSLVAIAKSPEADVTTRLRAAIAILQGPPPRRAALSTPTVPGGPCTPTAPRGPRSDRPTEPTPAPASAHTSAHTPAQAANTSITLAQRNSHTAPPPSLPAPTPAQVTRAAGAPFARHDRIATEPAIHIPPCASPPPSARPP